MGDLDARCWRLDAGCSILDPRASRGGRTMLFPQEIIDEVRDRTDIVDLISEYVALKKSGENYKARCPFHVEKTPSFVVSPTKQIFHCFGCGAGGNVYTFLTKTEGLNFPEAVKRLAERAGINLPHSRGTEAKAASERQILYNINLTAGSFYQKALNAPEGARAKNYLLHRGLKETIIEQFKLGYAPPGWDNIKNYLLKQKFPLEMITRSGLIINKEGTNNYYDRFRDRLIFPITDIHSRAIGFGARVLDDSLPKYINSPETPVYSKGKNLYGLRESKESIRSEEKVIIVEGYTDLLACHQHGVTNVVATLGTALTAEQVKLLGRYTQEAVIIFDPDTAGVAASLRGLEILMEGGLNVRVVSLPEGLDPSDFLTQKGPEAFRIELARAVGLLDYRLVTALNQYDISTAEGKARVVESLLPSLIRVSNAIKRDEFIRKLAETLNLEEALIRTEIIQFQGRQKGVIKDYIKKEEKRERDLEKEIICLTLKDRDARAQVKKNLSPDDFLNSDCRKVMVKIMELDEEGNNFERGKIIDFLDKETAGLISSSLLKDQGEVGPINDYIIKIRERNLNARMDKVQREISRMEKSGDVRALAGLLSQYQSLVAARRNLRGGLR
ncbi:MAG: DNA primase [bacterium]